MLRLASVINTYRKSARFLQCNYCRCHVQKVLASSWSDTCNLPKASIPTRHKAANDLDIQNDPLFYSEKHPKSSEEAEIVLHDGPPYANGDLHMGHAVNKVLKDFIVRYHRINGSRATVSFIPGWDCHGMPIEHKVLKVLKNDSHSTRVKVTRINDPVYVRKECRKLAENCIDKQMEGFKRWGVSANWDSPYLTYDTKFVVEELKIIYKFFEAGLLFRGKLPVHYSPSSASVLADSEIEYRDLDCTAVYIGMLLTKYPKSWKTLMLSENSKISVVVWTTQAWTVPANAAIAFNPGLKYVLVSEENTEEIFLIEKSAKERLEQKLKRRLNVLRDVQSNELEEVAYQLDFDGKGEKKLFAADFVTSETGTGFVHIAPSHGSEDFNLARENDIPFQSAVDSSGKFNCPEISELHGQLAMGSGNEACIKILESMGLILHKDRITHSYPCDWRTKEPVMTLLSQQWFIDVSKIIPDAVESLQNVNFVPANSKTSFVKMLSERSQWCISRQRHWGVPLPVFYDENDNVVLNNEILNHLISVFQDNGIDSWWNFDSEQLLPEEYQKRGLRKGSDILDVWFDSGSSWQTVLGSDETVTNPKKVFYVEGRDQYRGWFQSSLLTCFAIKRQAPFTHLYAHGFVLDQSQNKMSKSVGNVVDPKAVVAKYGADTLRLWVALADTTDDIAYSERIMEKTATAYQKFRLILRVLSGNLYDFNSENSLSWHKMKPIDQYIIVKCNDTVKKYHEEMNQLSFHTAVHGLLNFAHDDVSTFYLSSIKDRLYCDHARSQTRRSAQTALLHVFKKLHRSLEPFVPYLCHEICQGFLFSENDLYGDNSRDFNSDYLEIFELLKSVRSEVLTEVGNDLKVLEKCDIYFYYLNTNVLSPLLSEACVREIIGCRTAKFRTGAHFQPSNIVEVSEICANSLKIGYDVNETFEKCPRCRLFLSDAIDQLCRRCSEVVHK